MIPPARVHPKVAQQDYHERVISPPPRQTRRSERTGAGDPGSGQRSRGVGRPAAEHADHARGPEIDADDYRPPAAGSCRGPLDAGARDHDQVDAGDAPAAAGASPTASKATAIGVPAEPMRRSSGAGAMLMPGATPSERRLAPAGPPAIVVALAAVAAISAARESGATAEVAPSLAVTSPAPDRQARCARAPESWHSRARSRGSPAGRRGPGSCRPIWVGMAGWRWLVRSYRPSHKQAQRCDAHGSRLSGACAPSRSPRTAMRSPTPSRRTDTCWSRRPAGRPR
jgi:hypothetical protein